MRVNRLHIKWIFVLMVPVVLLSLSACDNSIDPLDRETGIYAIYGVLDLNEQTNYIRVRDMNVPFTAEATLEIDAEVTLENLQTGSILVLESERQQYEDIYVHNFVVNEEIQYDTGYRFTARRSDGVAVAMDVTTPKKAEANASPINQDCYTPIEVVFTPANLGTILYSISYDYSNDERFGGNGVLRLDENDSDSTSFSFTPIDVVSRLIGSGGRLSCSDLDNENFYINYWHYSSGLYEKVINDPFDILGSTQRFGAIYRDRLVIPIDTSRVCPPDC